MTNMTATTNGKLALVLGAAGGAGSAIGRALLSHGWRVRALARSPQSSKMAALLPGAEWVQGDAMNAADVRRAAEGATVIVHAAHPGGYRNWGKVILPMIDNTIAAAEAVGARIMLPGTIYNFAPETFPRLREDTPQQPRTRKGKIRAAMEARLEAASKRGVRVLILRAGDFFGPHTISSWLGQGMVTPGKPVKSVLYPGKRDAAHAWAYLPDFAETTVRLLDRETDLATFARFHFGGHQFARGVEIAERVGIVARGRKTPINGMPWFAVVALSPFVPLFRELSEMRYLWQRSHELDNSRLVAFLGEEPHTPLDQALRVSLEGLGCLPATPKTNLRLAEAA